MKSLIFISFIVLTNILSAQNYCEEYFEALKNNSDAAKYEYNERCIVQYRNYNGFIKNKKGRARERELYNDSGQIISKSSVSILGSDSTEYCYSNAKLVNIDYVKNSGMLHRVFQISYDSCNRKRVMIKYWSFNKKKLIRDTILYDYILKNDYEYERLVITKPDLVLATSNSKQSHISITAQNSDSLVNIYDRYEKKIVQLTNNDTISLFIYNNGLLEKEKYYNYSFVYKYDSSSNLIEQVDIADDRFVAKVVYSYDPYNCLLEEIKYDENEQLDIKIVYDYESHGLINSRTIYNSKNKVIEYKRYNYTFHR